MLIDDLRQYSSKIHTTHRGVIVIEMNDHREICIYHPDLYDLPAIPILTSAPSAQTVTVVKGRAIHVVYIVEPLQRSALSGSDVYVMVEGTPKLVSTSLGLVAGMSRVHHVGMQWDTEYGTLQDVVPCALCVTEGKLREHAPAGMQTRIVVPTGEAIDLTPLHATPKIMWEAVADAMQWGNME